MLEYLTHYATLVSNLPNPRARQVAYNVGATLVVIGSHSVRYVVRGREFILEMAQPILAVCARGKWLIILTADGQEQALNTEANAKGNPFWLPAFTYDQVAGCNLGAYWEE